MAWIYAESRKMVRRDNDYLKYVNGQGKTILLREINTARLQQYMGMQVINQRNKKKR